MIAASQKPIQGLLPAKNSCEHYWSLKARIELSVFVRNDVETLEKVASKPYSLTAQKGGVDFWLRFALNVVQRKLGLRVKGTFRIKRYRDICAKYAITDLAKVLKTQFNKLKVVKSASLTRR